MLTRWQASLAQPKTTAHTWRHPHCSLATKKKAHSSSQRLPLTSQHLFLQKFRFRSHVEGAQEEVLIWSCSSSFLLAALERFPLRTFALVLFTASFSSPFFVVCIPFLILLHPHVSQPMHQFFSIPLDAVMCLCELFQLILSSCRRRSFPHRWRLLAGTDVLFFAGGLYLAVAL